MLFNDKIFAEEVANHFIGVASSDVAYHNISDVLKDKAEFRFLIESLQDGGSGLHQGIYVVTSSGKNLGKINRFDPEKGLADLIRAKQSYAQLTKKERVGDALTIADRSLIVPIHRDEVNLTKLTCRARHYDFAQMESFDVRSPIYSKRASIWFSETESRDLLPASFKQGEVSDVGVEVMKKILLKSDFQFSCEAWWESHIKEQTLNATVSKKSGDLVYLSYKGSFYMVGDSEWNQSKLRGNVLGKAIWDMAKKEFTMLEFVSLSDAELGKLKSNMHRGNVKQTEVASYLRLAKTEHERSIAPGK